MAQEHAAESNKTALSVSLYANYFEIAHTPYEFVLDFGQSYANGQTSCHTRIVTSPTYARALLQTLTAAFEAYQRDFGESEEK